MKDRVWVEISKENLENNINEIRKHTFLVKLELLI